MSLPSAAQLAALDALVRANKLGDVLPANWRTAVAEWAPSAAEVGAIKQTELAARALDQLHYRPMPKYIAPAVVRAVGERLPALGRNIRRLADVTHGKSPPQVSLADSAALFAASVDVLQASMLIGDPQATARWIDANDRFAASVDVLERSTRATTVHAAARYTLTSHAGLLGLLSTALWLASWLTTLLGYVRFLSSPDFATLINSSNVLGTGLLGEILDINAGAVADGLLNNVVVEGASRSWLQVLFGYTMQLTTLGMQQNVPVPGVITSFDRFLSDQMSFALGDIARVHGAPGALMFWIVSWLLGKLIRWTRAGVDRIQTIEYVSGEPQQPAPADPAEDSDDDGGGGVMYD